MQRIFLNIRSLFLLAAAVALLLAAGGCGGSDSSASENGEVTVESGSLSKAQFVKQADAICQKRVVEVQLKFRPLSRSFASASPAEQEAEASKFVNDVIVPAYEEQIEEVSALGAPSGEEEKVAAVLNAIQARLGDAKEDPSKFLQTASPFAKAAKLGRAYGFTVCGGP
jgi:hypothetical protein